jgi:hypothetical protein
LVEAAASNKIRPKRNPLPGEPLPLASLNSGGVRGLV